MEEKLRVDREVLRTCSVPSVLPAWPGNTRQVAFLFMTEDGLDFEVVWETHSPLVCQFSFKTFSGNFFPHSPVAFS